MHNNDSQEGDTTKFHKIHDLSDGRTQRIENDVAEIKNDIKTMMEGLLGSIHEGEPKIGLYEEVRIAKYDIKQLKLERENIKSLNESINSLNKWKYYIVGALVLFIGIIDRVMHWLSSVVSNQR